MADFVEPAKAKTDKVEKILRAGIRCQLSAPQILDHWRAGKRVYVDGMGQNVWIEKLGPLWKDSPSLSDCWQFCETVFGLLPKS